ncbi:MAG: hemolysin family protein [Arachnia sp.]
MNVIQDIALIGVFILIGGTFAAAEMALISLRESRVKQLANKGKRGRAIQRLVANPNLFLSSVQIGVTLSGFLSAAFGGATLATSFAPVLQSWGVPASISNTVALVLITVVISYFSIVIGELTAKRLAMQRAESFALALAPLVSGIATVARPLIWFLGVSTNAVVRIFGGDPSLSRDSVTDEELRAMLSDSATLGTEERSILDEVFDAGDSTLREIMVPRTEVDFLPADMPVQRAYREVRGAPHSRYPVTDGSVDRIVGFLHVRDLMDIDGAARVGEVRSIVRPVLSLPETVKILRALSSMRKAGSHMAIVRDEYGGTSGIVTMEDLMEELIGDITDEYDVVGEISTDQVNRVDGLTTIEEFAESTGYILPEGPYDTVAGYVMAQLGELPQMGSSVTVQLLPEELTGDGDEHGEFTLTVVELDARRAAWFSLRRELPDDTPGDADG